MEADLHVHTTASDGTYSPAQIAQKAIEVGLSTISITDHDTVNGYLEIYSIQYPKLKVIPGVELNTEVNERDVHVLGYWIDVSSCEFIDALRQVAKARNERVATMVARLQNLGYSISYDQVVKLAQGSVALGRPHVAMALKESGYVQSVPEAFISLLSKKSPAYVPHYKLSFQEAVKLIHKAHGIPVLAHPGLIGDDTLVNNLLQDGILGIEVYHPTHNWQQRAKYLSIARQQNLIITGGSDFHGMNKGNVKSLGKFSIPHTLVDNINKMHETQKNAYT